MFVSLPHYFVYACKGGTGPRVGMRRAISICCREGKGRLPGEGVRIELGASAGWEPGEDAGLETAANIFLWIKCTG